VGMVERNEGKVGYKTNPDGTQSPYELNINYFDALAVAGSEAIAVDRFVAAHAIMLSLIGMPGIYFHSLFGSRGWPDGVKTLGHNRAINREKLNLAELEQALSVPDSRRSQVLSRLTHLLRVRAQQTAFDPHGQQHIVRGNPKMFVALRTGRASNPPVLCIVNVTEQATQVSLPWAELLGAADVAHDLVSDEQCELGGAGVAMEPYQVRWLIGNA